MKFLQKYLSYVPSQYANRLFYFSRTVLRLDVFLIFGKEWNIVAVHKKGDEELTKDNDRCIYCQFAENFWESWCSTQSSVL